MRQRWMYEACLSQIALSLRPKLAAHLWGMLCILVLGTDVPGPEFY